MSRICITTQFPPLPSTQRRARLRRSPADPWRAASTDHEISQFIRAENSCMCRLEMRRLSGPIRLTAALGLPDAGIGQPVYNAHGAWAAVDHSQRPVRVCDGDRHNRQRRRRRRCLQHRSEFRCAVCFGQLSRRLIVGDGSYGARARSGRKLWLRAVSGAERHRRRRPVHRKRHLSRAGFPRAELRRRRYWRFLSVP